MSNSEKSAYFRHVFANFLGAFFQAFFNGFEISAVAKKKIWGSY